MLCLLSGDTSNANRVEALLVQGGTISVQVLNEAVNVMTKKLNMGLDEVCDVLAGIRYACDVQPVTIETHDQALAITRRSGFSIDDSGIVAAAAGAGCTTLYSEDLHDGQRIGPDLTITNPFKQESQD
ncbi:PIN domain-containing protein [Microvirga sp. 0TCS3.31]